MPALSFFFASIDKRNFPSRSDVPIAPRIIRSSSLVLMIQYLCGVSRELLVVQSQSVKNMIPCQLGGESYSSRIKGECTCSRSLNRERAEPEGAVSLNSIISSRGKKSERFAFLSNYRPDAACRRRRRRRGDENCPPFPPTAPLPL